MNPKRLESVWVGRDNALLDEMLNYYAPTASKIIDVCCNSRRMWKGSRSYAKVTYYDRDPSVNPDRVVEWSNLPEIDSSVDVLIYDPPHLPDAAASRLSLAHYKKDYGLGEGVKGDNIMDLHPSFLREAARVLKPDGLIFSKIKDYIHNHKYQWNLELFHEEVRKCGLTPCDLIVKRDPCGGNLKSGRWIRAHHAKNVHCYWSIVRNGKCEPKRVKRKPKAALSPEEEAK